MIRDKFYKNILSTIDKHERFDSTEFKVETVADRNNSTSLSIKYNIDPKYKIVFKVPSTTTNEKNNYGSTVSVYTFSGSVCPGPLAIQETFAFSGEEGVFERITIWLNCIWEELSSNPIVKKVENQQTQIDEIFQKFESIKDEYFTEVEAVDLKKRLDELEETLKEEISLRTEDKKIFDLETSKLHTDIDTLKQTITALKKKGWLKSFTGKIFKWAKDSENKNLLTNGYNVVREFLPDNMKTALPQ